MVILRCTFIAYEKKRRNNKWNGVLHPAFPLLEIQATGDCFLQHILECKIYPSSGSSLFTQACRGKSEAGHQYGACIKLELNCEDEDKIGFVFSLLWAFKYNGLQMRNRTEIRGNGVN